MKLFAIKSDKKELYFQLEKTNEGLKILDTIAQILFGNTEFFFDMEWQLGLPKKESYLGHEFKGVFIGATVSEKRIHLLIRGLKEKNKIKKIKSLIFEKYKLIKPGAGN
jgi:hypothetical protein|tara:strand:+ start:22010 stop:22336 length:327 start_codon:yes stop_codon:yes gene_type:complete